MHCIDSSSENIVKDYEIVRKELGEFNQKLLEKQEIIVITKVDNISKEKIDEIKKILKETGKKVIAVSIYDKESLDLFKTSAIKLMKG